MAEIQIPGVDFNKLAESAIVAQITGALKNSDEMIANIVARALTTKVSQETGTAPHYSTDKTVPYVEYLAGDLIRKVAMETLKAKIDDLRPSIEKAVENALRASVKDTAKALVGWWTEATKEQYSKVSAEVKFTIKDPRY